MPIRIRWIGSSSECHFYGIDDYDTELEEVAIMDVIEANFDLEEFYIEDVERIEKDVSCGD